MSPEKGVSKPMATFQENDDDESPLDFHVIQQRHVKRVGSKGSIGIAKSNGDLSPITERAGKLEASDRLLQKRGYSLH